MATQNPFDLLVDDDSEDPTLLVSAQKLKIKDKKPLAQSGKSMAAGAKQTAVQPKLPSKPLPPAQAVREAKSESGHGGRGRGRGYGRGRGAGGGSYRDSPFDGNSHRREISTGQHAHVETDTGKPYERRGYGDYSGCRGTSRGGRRGGFSNGEVIEGDQDRPRRTFNQRSETEPGNEKRREGAGQTNWETQTDELIQVVEITVDEVERGLNAEKPSGEVDTTVDGNKEAGKIEVKEKEPEDKEMTLEEYEKIVEEKRKVVQALKTDGRKVDVKEFETMKQLSNRKTSDDVFIKLGFEKDKKKESAEKAKKSVSINEFLKPAEGERYFTPGGRGHGRGGRGRGFRGEYSGGHEASSMLVQAPSIEDPSQFPTLRGK